MFTLRVLVYDGYGDSSMSSDKRKTIAFCTSNLTSKLSRDIWAGIQKAALKENIHTVCYTGELLFPEKYKTNQSCANIVYKFIAPDKVDGLILYSGDIGELVTTERLLEFCTQFEGIPTVAVSREIPGIPTVKIDNYAGMYEVVKHLITVHSYKEIAFIKGPENNPEAMERFFAYCDALNDHGLSVNDRYLANGEFSRESGVAGVSLLLDSRQVSIDAIVCVDDETAVGVHEALQHRNIAVPKDIAIVGFDNDIVSGVLESPLTTVEQPVFFEGERALETVVQMLEGEFPSLQQILPAELVIRNSCGCSDHEVGIPEKNVPVLQGGSISLAAVRKKIEIAVDDFIRGIDLREDESFAENFATLLVQGFDYKDDSMFSTFLRRMLNDIGRQGKNMQPIQGLLFTIHAIASEELTSTEMNRFNTMLHRYRAIAGSFAERVNRYLKIEAIEKLIDLGDVNYALNALFSRNLAGELLSRISDSDFERLGINSFYLSLYSDSEQPLKTSRLMFAWEKGVSKEVYEKGIKFDTTSLLPNRYLDKLSEGHFAVVPLYFGSEQYGFLLIKTAPWDSMVCDILGWQISSAFRRVDLIRAEETKGKQLQQSLDELKETQARLIEAEKMASLGNLVAGVAHEINTPIGAGVTYASYFTELIDNMTNQFNQGTITKSGLEEFLSKGAEVSRGLMVNLNRAAELIRSFKEVAVDQTTSEVRRFNLRTYLDEIILSLKNVIKRNSVTLNLNCCDSIELKSCPGLFSQVITNLVMNSLTHAFEDTNTREITISVDESKTGITVRYRDNGIGMSSEIREKIFEPFFTTKRGSGGSGLGMHIVYNIVTQSLGGTIECQSEPGSGVLFIITIPYEISA